MAEAIVFDGPPSALHAVLSIAPKDRRAVQVYWGRAAGKGGTSSPIRVLTSPAGSDRTQVRLMLSPDTPPGRYDAVLRTHEGESPVVVAVRPRRHLRLATPSLTLELGPDGSEERIIDITNQGNVACEIRSAYAIGLFHTAGLDRAVGASMTTSRPGIDRLGILADTLADNHGGLLRLAVRDGSGVIEPGQWRQLHCMFRSSDRLHPGEVYFGHWRLWNVSASIHVHVLPAETPPEVR